MVMKLATWAKRLETRDIWFGKFLRLTYEVCVSAVFQSAIHIIASCLLGAFAYKESVLNRAFLIPFFIIYLLFIIVFCISNQHRKAENNITRSYESSFHQINQTLQAQYHSNLTQCNELSRMSRSEVHHYLSDSDDFDSICFQICSDVENLLHEICEESSFRVMTFLRTPEGHRDAYHINAYSPMTPAPEAMGKHFYFDSFVPHGKNPVHAEPFLNARFDPVVYNAEEIQKRFVDIHTARPTKLYIGIPCDINGKVVLTLQITSYDDYLGNALDLYDLINNVLVIYTTYLKIAYVRHTKYELLSNALGSVPV